MIDLSVAIVSFNTREVLARTIEAVLTGSEGLGVEVIVVDNASADGSAEMVRTRFPSVILLANETNRFYSAGNNQAMRASRGRYLLVLNPDAAPDAGTLAEMVAWMDGDPGIGALSPRMRFPDGRVQRNCARRWTCELLALEHTVWGLLRPRLRARRAAEFWYADWDRSTSRDVEVIPGSCMLVRREVFERTGGFDERLLLYFTEDDWCGRIREGGLRVAYAAIGGVVHPEGTSTATVRRLARRIYFDDMIRYAAKRFGRRRALLLGALALPTRWALDLAAAVRAR